MTHTHVSTWVIRIFKELDLSGAHRPFTTPSLRRECRHEAVPKLPMATVFEGVDVRPLDVCERLGGGRY